MLDTQYKRRWIFCLVLRLRLLGLVAFCEISTGWGEEDDGVGKGPVEDQLGSGGDHDPCWRRCWLRVGSGRSQASLIYPHVTSLRTKPDISCGSACDVTVFNWIRASCIALAVGLPACLEAPVSLDRRDLQEISRGMTSLFYSSEIPNSLASLGLTPPALWMSNKTVSMVWWLVELLIECARSLLHVHIFIDTQRKQWKNFGISQYDSFYYLEKA